MESNTGGPTREDLLAVFKKYIDHQDDNGHQYITGLSFVRNFIGMSVEQGYQNDVLSLLTRTVDTSKDGLVSFEEFCAFEKLLGSPDALYRIIFRAFDNSGTGFVTHDDFKSTYSKTLACKNVPFDFDSDFVKLHFGKNKQKALDFAAFTQMLHSLPREHVKQAFLKRDKDGNGVINPLDLKEIMTLLRANILSHYVAENLVALAQGNKVSFTTFSALDKLLGNIETYKDVFDEIAARHKTEGLGNPETVAKDEFLRMALQRPDITPLEVELLYQLVAFNHGDSESSLAKSDIDKLVPHPISEARGAPSVVPHTEEATNQVTRSPLWAVAESAYRFTLGSIAGSVGATAVYPIDLVKTRLQNQRSTLVGEVLYKNFWDCLFKVIKWEGYLGLYRGLPPQLVGVAPEKAIKLTMNDFVRDKVVRPDGSYPLWGEILAGGTAGGCQVIFTNPLEIVKIRLQVAGEVASAQRVSTFGVIRELGFRGLYKGARACLLRDIPFSAIYFPLYANLKKSFQDENGTNSMGSLFVAGVLAGIPAPFLTTPADVIKTRLQVKAREGQTRYNGVIDCAKKIYVEEGQKAFWKGANQRVFRSAPQFGVTLLTYEFLQRALPVNFGGTNPNALKKKADGSKTADVYVPTNPDHIGGLRTASATFAGMESKFGLFLPKFRNPMNSHIYEISGLSQ